MILYISNAFSLSMLDRASQCRVLTLRYPRPLDNPAGYLACCAKDGVDIISVVGHADTAALFSTILGIPIAVNRVSVKLTPDVTIMVGQYQGPRLQEGAISLPQGATIDWWLV